MNEVCRARPIRPSMRNPATSTPGLAFLLATVVVLLTTSTALLGLLSPANRGALMTVLVVFVVLMGGVGGHQNVDPAGILNPGVIFD